MIPGLEQGLAGDRITRMEGILNGTCNFILSQMEAGAEYATVLAEAQAQGYAEADPTEDVGGFDARAKLAILMRLALRVVVDPDEIVPQSIDERVGGGFQLREGSELHDSAGCARRRTRWRGCGDRGTDAGGQELAAWRGRAAQRIW